MDAHEANLEELLLRLLHHVGERLPTEGIVKGGLVLRLLDCPRHTNDLDIVLVPFASKRDAAPVFKAALESFPCDEITIQVHSTAIRARIRQGAIVAQVEASVADECPSIPMSTASLASVHHQLPRIVRVMKFEVSLANKLGAWMERGLLRDLYDIFYWVGLQRVSPDPTVLHKRLSLVRGRKGKPRAWTLVELAENLDASLETLSDEALRQELLPVMHEIELVGLASRMKGTLRGFILQLKNQEQP